MLNLGEELVFRTNLCQKLLVDCAYGTTQFTVDDASEYQTFKESLDNFEIAEGDKTQLLLNCVAAKRFHKPVQPKSWFFNHQSNDSVQPEVGDIVSLSNDFNDGLFMVLEVGDNASLCACIEAEDFQLTSNKRIGFAEAIKVMHDRISYCEVEQNFYPSLAMVG